MPVLSLKRYVILPNSSGKCARPDDSVGYFDVVHDEVSVHSFSHIQIDT